VYQQRSPLSLLCVWNIDATVAQVTNNATIPSGANGGYANAGAAGYNQTCVYPSVSYPVGPLTGPGAAIGAAEVIGYVTCPTAGSNSGCLLEAVADLPWAGGWWSVGATDGLGLSGNWTNISGTILGSGNGSTASFTNTQIEQVLRAYSCFVAPSSATGYTPQPCPPPKTPLGWLFDLSATPTIVNATGESNNLTNTPVTFACKAYDCWLSYNSSAP